VLLVVYHCAVASLSVWC